MLGLTLFLLMVWLWGCLVLSDVPGTAAIVLPTVFPLFVIAQAVVGICNGLSACVAIVGATLANKERSWTR